MAWPSSGRDVDAAVAGIFAAKGRPAFNPLIAHVLDFDAAREHAVFGHDAELLARAFWPGPLTLVLPAVSSCRVSLLARAGLDTLALRAPSHPIARALIDAAGVPLAAPSANRSGRVSPTTAAHVFADLDGRIDWILDGGSSRHGLESTIVSCLGAPALLRPGAVTREAIEAVLGGPLGSSVVHGRSPRAPGQLESHYAPRARLRLEAAQVGSDEAALDFAGALADGESLARLDLSPSRGPRRGGVEPVRPSASARRLGGADHSGGSHSSSRTRRRDQRQASASGRPERSMTAPAGG